jgi:hypothetical protein
VRGVESEPPVPGEPLCFEAGPRAWTLNPRPSHCRLVPSRPEEVVREEQEEEEEVVREEQEEEEEEQESLGRELLPL